jgi:uncharacterized protein (DUF362 family)
LLRKPTLCVVDASEFVITNGPAGPGTLKQANKIIAGTNPLSVDAYCATLMDRQPLEIAMIQYAQKHGLGETEITKLNIKES